MDFFKYNTIDLEGPAFRLIRLFKGDHEFIQCHLFEAWLDQQEGRMDYEALSYTWGDAERKPHDIIVNGSRMAVTQNLHVALRNLRCQEQDRILWVDAICINQDDHKERGHQVQQMASIYRKAEKVIIWLGPPTRDTDLAMNFMKRLEEESIKYTYNNWKASDKRWIDIWSHIQSGYSYDLISKQREGLVSLLGRDWFKRVWILQEVASARAAEIICGTKSVSARIFALTPFLAEITLDSYCQAVLDIMPGPSRRSSWWVEKRDLQTLLSKFGKSEATDQRDIIYALLGMSSDVSSSSTLKANYNKSVQEAIQDTTLFLLHIHESDYPIKSLPSWTLQEFLDNLNSLGNVFLEWAVKMGHEEVVELLVKRFKVDINRRDNESGQTLLSSAAERGHEAVVRQLLGRRDVSLDKKDNDSRTPLLIAAERGHEGVVKLLLGHHGVMVNTRDHSLRTPLSMAAERGHEAVVRLLIDSGADVNTKDKDEETALYKAALAGQQAVVWLLVNHGADVDTKGKDNETVLYKATLAGQQAVLRRLVEGGANINVRGNNTRTALQQMAFEENGVMVQLLVNLGANINEKDHSGVTALQQAALRGNRVMVQLLVNLGADLNERNNDKETALHQAALGRSGAMVQFLIELGSDINAKGKYEDTALFRAAFKGDTIIARLLLNRGVDINARDKFGDTALHRAAYRGYQGVVSLLIENKADVNIRSNEGETALYRATSGGYREVAKLLRAAGAS